MKALAEPELSNPADAGNLAKSMAALASPVRVGFLRRLAEPAFMPELVQACGMTRQTIKKHLDSLEGAGLVESRPARRRGLPARQYVASQAGLFALRENLGALLVPAPPALGAPASTRPMSEPVKGDVARRAGFLLVHGDRTGRWFPLDGRRSCVVGRSPHAEISLPYDPYASQRHALLNKESDRWSVTDLHSMNGTLVNLRPVPAGDRVPLRPGDLLTVGRSHLLLRTET